MVHSGTVEASRRLGRRLKTVRAGAPGWNEGDQVPKSKQQLPASVFRLHRIRPRRAAFFRTHELGRWQLFRPLNLRSRARTFLPAAAEGFDSAFLFRPRDAALHFDEILKQTAFTPVFGLGRPISTSIR
jgi:hypothetical protein